jgi:hypothetical protein
VIILSTFGGGFPGGVDTRPDHRPAQSQALPSAESASAPRDPAPPRWRVYIEDPYVRDAATRMLDEAAYWLSFPQCQELLLDFADQSGRPLSRRLTELGVTAIAYLRLIVFEDGTNRGHCRQSGILAFTSPGSRVIYLCGRDFMRAAERAPEDVRAAVIHEMLHSLGLGENPPSSREITRRVRQRCWR